MIPGSLLVNLIIQQYLILRLITPGKGYGEVFQVLWCLFEVLQLPRWELRAFIEQRLSLLFLFGAVQLPHTQCNEDR